MAWCVHDKGINNQKAIFMRCLLFKHAPQSNSSSLLPHQDESGFTLIELMMVVTIIGILAAIVGTNYHLQIRKAQFIAVYQELNLFRLPYQTLIDDGAGVTDFSASGLNIPEQTKYCQFTVTAPAKSGITTDAVKCTIKNLPYAQGETISLDRAADGSWQCRASAGIPVAYLPQACR